LYICATFFTCQYVIPILDVDAASVFGQLWRLEPLASERRVMWQREMEWLLSVSDHIVELVPALQTFPDGSTLEVRMTQLVFWFLL
jgi:hypothetical protein